MKKTYIIVIIMMAIISSYVLSDYRISSGRDYEVVNSEESESNQESEAEKLNESKTEMEKVYKALGRGFDLGNELDVCDWSYFGSNNNTGFQAAVSYNTYPWTAWDASEYPYFDSDGKVTIDWKLSNLNSKSSAIAGNFAIQLVNHNEEYQGTEVTCKVLNAKLSYPDGTYVNLVSQDGMSIDLVVNDGVTGYISLDLMQYGITTVDLKDATISVSLEISNYFSNIDRQIAALEQYWGNPQISEEMIKAIKDAGFDTIRIPVTYFNHLSSDGTIDEAFLNRVEEVVDWVLQNNLYCIIDIHHDTGNDGWIKASEANYDNNKDIVAFIFTQIAEKFKDKDQQLILEGLNEVVNDDNMWGNVPDTDLNVMNDWNQLFVDCVRATGGNNTDRFLLVNTYAALSIDQCLSAFKLPMDTAENRIFVGIHCYFNNDNMDSGFEKIHEYADDYHFIIGEWAFWKGSENRVELVKRYCDYADELNLPIIYWDNGNTEEMALLDRKTLNWTNQDIVNVILGK